MSKLSPSSGSGGGGPQPLTPSCTITISTPSAGGSVTTNFTTSGTTTPLGNTLTATLYDANRQPVYFGSPATLLSNDGNWSFNFTNVTPGQYMLVIKITDPVGCGVKSITIHVV